MTGFELNRFVGLTSNESEEYTCSICQDILRDPIVTNCCLHTFCKECMYSWLKTNNTCPFDRKKLEKNQLSLPPRSEKLESIKYCIFSYILDIL
jgi:hypothetical protein